MTTKEKYELTAEVLTSYHKGDGISDEDLNVAVDSLTDILYFIDKLPREFHFMWARLRTDLGHLEGFVEARKRK